MTAKQRIVVLGAQPEWLAGLRGSMIRDFLARGHDVWAIGAEEMPTVRATLERWGARYLVVPIRRAGLNPMADLRAMVILYRTLRLIRPDLVFAYTIKPVVYGMPVARAAGVSRRFAMISGRGYAFQEGAETSRRVAAAIAALFYRTGLRSASGVLFHNEDDLALFRSRGMLPARVPARRIFGSGIDLDHYAPQPMPTGPVTFLMIARLVIDKGITEFVDAARIVKAQYPDVVFRLIGPTDPSPNGVKAHVVAAWLREGIIDYPGAVPDVRPAIGACHVLVLPSYGEGLPHTVLEAMATGRGIITSDAPGCRDTVIEGVSGLIVPVRDAPAVAAAMIRFIESPKFIASAGLASLDFARDRFDVRKVNDDIAEFIGV